MTYGVYPQEALCLELFWTDEGLLFYFISLLSSPLTLSTPFCSVSLPLSFHLSFPFLQLRFWETGFITFPSNPFWYQVAFLEIHPGSLLGQSPSRVSDLETVGRHLSFSRFSYTWLSFFALRHLLTLNHTLPVPPFQLNFPNLLLFPALSGSYGQKCVFTKHKKNLLEKRKEWAKFLTMENLFSIFKVGFEMLKIMPRSEKN